METKKLYQVATLSNLMLGDYNGSVTVEELLKHGDTGIGTYDGLNGEAIVLDGVCYNGLATGEAKVMEKSDSLPFSTVCFFDENVKKEEISFADMADFKKVMAKHLEKGENYFYMVKMEGVFNVRVRSCFKQCKPYLPLYTVAKDQREYEYHEIPGYVIGVFCPNYVEGMNLPGWHIHFLSKDHTKGGHILELSAKSCDMKINLLNGWDVYLPSSDEFEHANLKEDLKKKTEAVEGGSKK